MTTYRDGRPADALPPTRERIRRWLAVLAPLPKIHYSWPIENMITLPKPLLYEYARMTHALCIRGEDSVQTATVDRVVDILDQVAATSPSITPSIGVNYAVWHRAWDAQLPPTDTGETHDAELALLQTRLEAVATAVAEANAAHSATIAVSAILFDSEIFVINEDEPVDQAWNDAIDSKYNLAHAIAQDVFPGVKVYWYNRGGVTIASTPTGWFNSTLFTLNELGDGFSVPLYHTGEIEVTREMYRRTYDRATAAGVTEVNPWVGLASGFQRALVGLHEYTADWNYDLIYSWHLGREINIPWFGTVSQYERYAPWGAAQVVIFYLPPFDARAPFWFQHFVAYCRGAQDPRVTELPE